MDVKILMSFIYVAVMAKANFVRREKQQVEVANIITILKTSMTSCSVQCNLDSQCYAFGTKELVDIGKETTCFLLKKDKNKYTGKAMGKTVELYVSEMNNDIGGIQMEITQSTGKLDGSWSHWSAYGLCSVSCNGGIRTRNRICNKPKPERGGLLCLISNTTNNRSDVEIKTVPCKVKPCPVDGSWSHWSAYGFCSVSCNGGNMTRNRTCNKPKPERGGLLCLIPNTTNNRSDVEIKTVPCKVKPCPGYPGYWFVFDDQRNVKNIYEFTNDGSFVLMDVDLRKVLYRLDDVSVPTNNVSFPSSEGWLKIKNTGSWLIVRRLENGTLKAFVFSPSCPGEYKGAGSYCGIEKNGIRGESCPHTHPYVYSFGQYCCTNKKEPDNPSAGCNEGELSILSACCEGKYIVCPKRPCNNYF